MAEIHDIPWKDYNQYAKNAEAEAKEGLKFKEERQIALPTKIEVTEPAFLSPVRALFQEDLCNARWSDIPVIDETIAKRSRCFSTELIPRLGSQEKLLALKDKLDKLGGPS